MATKNCIILQSCSTQEFAYTRSTASENTVTEPFWSALLGTVVQITDPANFPDIYYTVVDICFSTDVSPGVDCLECMSSTYTSGVYFSLPLEYVTPTDLEDCPVSNAFVLLNCSADPSVFNDELPLDEIVQSPDTVLITSSDLALYVGSVVNISEYPGNCYEVLGPYSGVGFCPCDYYTVTNAFKDCECCTPPPDDPTCCEIPKSTQKPVKIFYRVTDTECEIRDITRFAENYYRLYTSLYHGIKNCCGDLDLDKIWLKHELSSYNKINPTGFCTPPVDIVCPEPCPEP